MALRGDGATLFVVRLFRSIVCTVAPIPAKFLTRKAARRIALGVVKLPELLGKP
jgi:hypothetical protein